MHRVNSADPHQYDMVLDSHSLGLDIAVEVIARAVEAGRPTSDMAAGTGSKPLTVNNQTESPTHHGT
jgi:cytidylate kinase